MKIYVKAWRIVDVLPEWQTRVPTVLRRKLELRRGKKLCCASCRREIKGDYMIMVHIAGYKNKMVCEKCADARVEIREVKNSRRNGDESKNRV